MEPAAHQVPAERAALATAAAERMLGVLAVTASARTLSTVNRLIDDLWSILANGTAVDAEAIIRRIERLTEAQATNPDRRSYLAMEALEAVATAYAELRPGHPMAGRYEDVAAGIMSALDGLERQEQQSGPRMIDPRKPPPPGRFEADELGRQRDDVAVLRAQASVADAIPALRTGSEAVGAQLLQTVRRLVGAAYPSMRSRIAMRLGLSEQVTLRDAD